MNTQTVTINLVPGLSTPPVVNVKQGDIGRPIAFRVMDGTGLMTAITGATAKIEGTKPSGLGFSVTGTISGNMVTLDTTEAMTQECGRIPAEIKFTSTLEGVVLGTANFILAVERDPHPDGTTDGTQETMADLQTQLNGLDTRVTALEAGGGGSGLTDDVKTALLNCFAHVAWVDADGQDYYDALESALNSGDLSVSLMLSQVSSSNTATTVGYGESYTTTLTASTGYTLNTVSVTMGGVDITSTSYSSGTVSIPSVTGNIVITATAVLAAQSITATYTQSGTVYTTDSLDSLKTDLVVTANYSGGGSDTVPASAYTLSGTLTVGTSTITVTYAGLTDTFSVTVTANYVTNGLFAHWDAIDNQATGTHSSNATTWVDKVNGYTWAAMKTDGTQTWSWDSDGLIFSPAGGSGSTNGKNTFNCTRPGTGLRTLEIVFTPENTTSCVGEFTSDLTGVTDNTTQIIGVFSSDNTATSVGVQNGYQVTSITSIKSISATYSSSYAAVKFYKNAEEITSQGSSHSFKYHGNSSMILGAQNNDALTYPYGFKGTIHSIRMYSRELTAAEIAQNYAVDVQRFGLS